MKIKADLDGNIEVVGEDIDGITYDEKLPDDFYHTFALGKYIFKDGSLHTVSTWTPPKIVHVGL